MSIQAATDSTTYKELSSICNSGMFLSYLCYCGVQLIVDILDH